MTKQELLAKLEAKFEKVSPLDEWSVSQNTSEKEFDVKRYDFKVFNEDMGVKTYTAYEKKDGSIFFIGGNPVEEDDVLDFNQKLQNFIEKKKEDGTIIDALIEKAGKSSAKVTAFIDSSGKASEKSYLVVEKQDGLELIPIV